MSDGGIGNGISFWATIRIAGKLEKVELKAVTGAIRDILNKKGVNGELVHSVRLTADEMPVISISMKESNTHRKQRRRKRN
jgi:hypothetical protein